MASSGKGGARPPQGSSPPLRGGPGATGLGPVSCFVLGLTQISSDALQTFAMARAIACRPFEPGPVESALREMLGMLSELRVQAELGTRPGDDILADIPAVFDRLPEIDIEAMGRFGSIPLHAWSLQGPSPILAMAAPILPPLPDPLPPEAGGIIDEILALIRELLDRGILEGDAAAEIRALLAHIEELIEAGARSETIVGALGRLIRLLLAALGRLAGVVPPKVLEGILSAIRGLLGRLGPLLGRALVFLGPLLWLLFAAQVGYAAGTEMAKIHVNDDETLGQWWGNRLWELLKGPCPDLLDALNLAILRWRALQSAGAPEKEVAQALARVLVLESEYIRRCLTPGSTERTNEEQYLKGLEEEYARLQGRIHGTTGAPGRACHVVVTLDRVTYDGADLGDTWGFQVIAHGATTDFAKHSFRPNEAETPNRVVLDQVMGPCPGNVPFTVTVQATSFGMIYNSVGITPTLVSLDCPEQITRSLVVRVRDGNDVADLTFNFTVTGQCVDAAGSQPVTA